MNTLKMFQLVVLITVLSVMTGCSDQLTSSGNSDAISTASKTVLSESKNTGEYSESTGIRNRSVVKTQIRLNPHSSFSFDYQNTGLTKFTSIRVVDLIASPNFDTDLCDKLQISGNDNLTKQILSCESSGFNLKEIVVSNISEEYLDADVTLSGSAFVITPDEK